MILEQTLFQNLDQKLQLLRFFKPYSFALFPTSSAAICAAYGVDFLEPLKPL